MFVSNFSDNEFQRMSDLLSFAFKEIPSMHDDKDAHLILDLIVALNDRDCICCKEDDE